MPKTKRYKMMVENCEVDLTNWIEISAEQYWNEMKKWDKIIEETKDNENTGPATKFSIPAKREGHEVRYMDYLNVGCATVYLVRCELDEGYKYVPKARQKKSSKTS